MKIWKNKVRENFSLPKKATNSASKVSATVKDHATIHERYLHTKEEWPYFRPDSWINTLKKSKEVLAPGT